MSIGLSKRNDRFGIFLHLDKLTKFRKQDSKIIKKSIVKLSNFGLLRK